MNGPLVRFGGRQHRAWGEQPLKTISLWVWIALAGLTLAIPVGASPVTVSVGTIQPLPTPDVDGRGLAGYQWCFGMQAAFDEANSAQLLGPGKRVQLTVRAAYNTGDARNTLLVDDLLVASNVTMIAGSSIEVAQEALAASIRYGAPLVGASASDAASLYATSSRVAVNYRFSYAEEVWQMINVALNSKLRCNRFGIVHHYSAGLDLSKDMLAKLSGLGHTNVTIGPYGLTNDSYAMWNNSVRTILSNRPHCVFFLGDAQGVQDFMTALTDQPNFDVSNTYFITASTGNSPVWRDSRLQNRTFVVQQVPSPFDTGFDIVKRYQAAAAAFDAKGYYDPPGKGFALPSGYGRVSVNYFGLEGYILGRLVVEILRRVASPNVTRSDILSVVYDEKLFKLDDLLLGPFMGGCEGKMSSSSVPCFCNSGNKFLYTSYVGVNPNTTAMTTLPYIADSTQLEDPTVSRLEMPLSACAMPDDLVRTPTIFLSVTEVPAMFAKAATYSRAVAYQSMFVATLFAIQYANVRRSTVGALVALTLPVLSTDTATLEQLADRYPLTAFAGGIQRSDLNVSGYVTASGYDAGEYRLTDPPLAEWREENIALEPVLADYVHALAAKLGDDTDRNGAIPLITILATSTAEAELAAKSLHTFQLTFDEPMVYPTYSGSASALLYLTQDLRGRLTSGMDDVHRVLFVVSQTSPFIDSVVKLALAEMPRLRVFVATSEEVLESSLNGMTAVERSGFDAQRHNIFFSSLFDPFWQRRNVVTVSDAVSAVDAFDLIRSLVGLTRSFSALRGFRAAAAMYSAHEAVYQVISPSRYLRAWYSQGTVNSADFLYGPFYQTACSQKIVATNEVDRTCQCSKAVRSIKVHSLTDWGLDVALGKPNVSFTYHMRTCGVQYRPLTVPAKSDRALIIGLGATGLSLAFVILLLGFIYSKRPSKDNSFAPKDPYAAYTIVFTDIQSSTALWARAPEQMAEALEVHHGLIRGLIKKYGLYEVKTVGDSFMIACSDANAAARMTVDLQMGLFDADWRTSEIDECYRELIRQSLETSVGLADSSCRPVAKSEASWNPALWKGLRVRVGVHTGFGEIKQDSVSLGYDYYGTVVNTAARAEGVGHGGQILLTEAAFDAAGGYKPGGAFAEATVTCLGPQPLRGLDEPVVLYQVVPNRLKAREFASLRLEVEHAVDGDDSTTAETASQLEDWEPEALAKHAAQRAKGETNYASFYNQLMRAHGFTLQLLSTQPEKQRARMLDQLAQRWQVPLRKAKNLSATELFERQMMLVVLKAYAVYDRKSRGSGDVRRPTVRDDSSQDRTTESSRRPSQKRHSNAVAEEPTLVSSTLSDSVGKQPNQVQESRL